MTYFKLISICFAAWSVGTCLSMKSSAEVVEFDAATIFGGIIQNGKPKPGDSLPITRRDEMKALMEPTRRTIKVNTFSKSLCITLSDCLCSSFLAWISYSIHASTQSVEGGRGGLFSKVWEVKRVLGNCPRQGDQSRGRGD